MARLGCAHCVHEETSWTFLANSSTLLRCRGLVWTQIAFCLLGVCTKRVQWTKITLYRCILSRRTSWWTLDACHGAIGRGVQTWWTWFSSMIFTKTLVTCFAIFLSVLCLVRAWGNVDATSVACSFVARPIIALPACYLACLVLIPSFATNGASVACAHGTVFRAVVTR